MASGKWQTPDQKKENDGRQRVAREKSHAHHPPASRLSEVLPVFSTLGSPTVSLQSFQGVVVSYLATQALLNNTPYTENERRCLSGKTPIVM